MIEWMQTHRKWLVITIWIATIAFVGAGFVGWGQFQFNKKENVIAKVKDTEVTIKDWQNAYNIIFDEVNKQFGGKLDEATAKKLSLQKEAFNLAINQAIFRQYAKDLGLIVTDKDVAKKILEVFKSKDEYKKYLKLTGQKAKEFEENLKKQLLIEKLFEFLHLKPENSEVLTIGESLYNADNLDIKVIDSKKIKVSLNEEDIKSFWEKNKNRYLSDYKYKLAVTIIDLNENVDENRLKEFYSKNRLQYKNQKGEILPFEKVKERVKTDYLAKIKKKEAILAYKKLKESTDNSKLITVKLNNDIIPFEKMQTLIEKGIVKPFVYKNRYITAKLIEEIKPQPLSFKEAKDLVTKDLIKELTSKKLIEIAKNEIKNFKGENIGFVTKYDFNKIKKLPPVLAEEFLFKVFTSQHPKGIIFLPEKNPVFAVLYKIKEQKLLDKDKFKKHKDLVMKLTESLINNELYKDILKELKHKYEIVTYIKDNN